MLKQLTGGLSDETYSIFIKPNIAMKKAINAIYSFAMDISYDDILILIDETAFGSAKEGMIITKDRIYAKTISNSCVINIRDIVSCYIKKATIGFDIIINGSEYYFTQPDFQDASVIIDNLAKYIENNASAR